MENRHQEYTLSIEGPSTALLVGHLQENYGWVFSEFGTLGHFSGYAIGYTPNYSDVSQFEGFGISDGTRIDAIDNIVDF